MAAVAVDARDRSRRPSPSPKTCLHPVPAGALPGEPRNSALAHEVQKLGRIARGEQHFASAYFVLFEQRNQTVGDPRFESPKTGAECRQKELPRDTQIPRIATVTHRAAADSEVAPSRSWPALRSSSGRTRRACCTAARSAGVSTSRATIPASVATVSSGSVMRICRAASRDDFAGAPSSVAARSARSAGWRSSAISRKSARRLCCPRRASSASRYSPALARAYASPDRQARYTR